MNSNVETVTPTELTELLEFLPSCGATQHHFRDPFRVDTTEPRFIYCSQCGEVRPLLLPKEENKP